MSVHVVPVDDLVEHTDDDCVCGPDYEFVHPETGVSYGDGPVVFHHSLDGREAAELVGPGEIGLLREFVSGGEG